MDTRHFCQHATAQPHGPQRCGKPATVILLMPPNRWVPFCSRHGLETANRHLRRG